VYEFENAIALHARRLQRFAICVRIGCTARFRRLQPLAAGREFGCGRLVRKPNFVICAASG